MKKCLAAITLISVLCWYTPLRAQEAESSYLPPPELQKLDGLLSKLSQNQPLDAAEANDLLTLSNMLSNLLRAGGHKDVADEIREKLEKMDWYAVGAILDDQLEGQQELTQKLAQESALAADEHQRLQELSVRLTRALVSPLFRGLRAKIRKRLVQYGSDAVQATMPLLDNADLTVRLQAALALSGIEDEKASQALLTILVNEKEKEALRLVAIKGLGKKKASEAVDSLVKLLSHPKLEREIRELLEQADQIEAEAARKPALIRAEAEAEAEREASSLRAEAWRLEGRLLALAIPSAKALKEIGDKKALGGLVKLMLWANNSRGPVTSKVIPAREKLEAFKDHILSTAPKGTRWEEVVLTRDEEVRFKSIKDQLEKHERELADLNLAIIAAAEAISTLTEGKQAKDIPGAQDNATLQTQIKAVESWWQEQQSSTASP